MQIRLFGRIFTLFTVRREQEVGKQSLRHAAAYLIDQQGGVDFVLADHFAGPGSDSPEEKNFFEVLQILSNLINETSAPSMDELVEHLMMISEFDEEYEPVLGTSPVPVTVGVGTEYFSVAPELELKEEATALVSELIDEQDEESEAFLENTAYHSLDRT